MGAKQAVISLAARTGFFPAGLALQKAVFGHNFIRVLNYHPTPATHAANFERQLQFYARHYTPVGSAQLEACLAGDWSADKPGLLMTFDDGYQSNYDVAAPLLEKFGFLGFFFIPEGYMAEDRASAARDFEAARGEPEPRMTWDECRDLEARGHRVGCHSRTHVRLADALTPEQLADEISQSGIDISQRLGKPVEDFCWVGGEEWSYGSGAFAEIRGAGYKRAFMTNLYPVLPKSSPLWIQRTNIEADWPLDQVRFYLSGLMDVAYAPKRKRLAAKLQPF